MIDEKIEKIKEIITEFFSKMTVPVSIENQELDGQLLKITLSSTEAQVLIGAFGATLSDIQALLARLIRKQVGQDIFLDIDVNGYKSDKEERFRDLAQEMADEAVARGKEKILFPMGSFERRIIHTELAKRSDVKTESVGEGDNRRVIIKPI